LPHTEFLGWKCSIQPVIPDVLTTQLHCFGRTKRAGIHAIERTGMSALTETFWDITLSARSLL
jgi:hypothetical protein